MIRAVACDQQGTPQAVILGLSAENVGRLQAGQPIAVRLQELDPRLPDISVAIVVGEDEAAILEELRTLAPIRSVQPGPGWTGPLPS